MALTRAARAVLLSHFLAFPAILPCIILSPEDTATGRVQAGTLRTSAFCKITENPINGPDYRHTRTDRNERLGLWLRRWRVRVPSVTHLFAGRSGSASTTWCSGPELTHGQYATGAGFTVRKALSDEGSI